MKIVLNADAVCSVKKLQEQIRSKNEFAQKRFSPMVSQVLIKAVSAFTEKHLEELANALVSPDGQKKVLLKRLEKLAAELGEDSISKLERSIKRNKSI